MTYVREWDELPWEARPNASATFAFWPKVDGRNVLVSSVANEVAYSVREPSGNVVQAATSVSPVAVSAGSRNISRVDITFPSVVDLGEGYIVRIVFQEDGSSIVRTEERTVDVVRVPFDQPRVSYNDFVEERPSADALLNRIGQRYGYASGDEACEYAASVFAGKGRWLLYQMIRAAMVAPPAASAVGAPAPRSARGRPWLILRRDQLVMIERYLAIKALYLAVSTAPEDGTEEADQAYRIYNKMAEEAFASLGPLEYDTDQDGAADELVVDAATVFQMRRRQSP